MRDHRTVFLLALGFIAIGCQQDNRQACAESVLNRPLPATDEERVRECNALRSEIARQQSLGQVGTVMATSPLMGVAMQAAARNNIAALEARASNVECTAAFSNASRPTTGKAPNFDQCFARCQEYTSRTKEQCFDACNK